MQKNKICPLCERIYKGGGTVCKDCDQKMYEIARRAHSKYRLSVSKINSLRNLFKQKDILEYLLNNPQLIYTKIDPEKSKAWLKYRKFQLKENLKNKKYQDVPLYVKHFFSKNTHLGLINICGNKQDPFITFVCKI